MFRKTIAQHYKQRKEKECDCFVLKVYKKGYTQRIAKDTT